MRTMFLAAAAVLTLGVGSAYAGDGGGSTTTQFTIIESQLAHGRAPGQAATAHAANRSVQAYVTSSDRGTWLYPPNQNGGNG